MEWARLRFLALFHDPGTSEHIETTIVTHSIQGLRISTFWVDSRTIFLAEKEVRLLTKIP